MSFPIEFSKKVAINFTGNAAIVGLGGISLALISNLA